MQLEGYEKTLETMTAIGGTRARKALRTCMNRGLTVIVRGIKGKLGSRARTKGRSLTRIRRGVGRRVKKGNGENTIQGKVGYAVGKPRGSVPPHGLWKFWGTNPRYTGSKITRARFFGVKSKYEKSTGKARRYTGRVPEGRFVQDGLDASSSAAASLMETIAEQVLLRELIPSPESDFDTSD